MEVTDPRVQKWLIAKRAIQKYMVQQGIDLGDAVIEVRSKAKLNKYNATGVDVWLYRQFITTEKETGRRIFMFFVDEGIGKIYGNYLDVLKQPHRDKRGALYPNYQIAKGKVLFSCEQMPVYGRINDGMRQILKEYNTRNYNYKIQNETNETKTTAPKVAEPQRGTRQQKIF